jgi:hypothetical protein
MRRVYEVEITHKVFVSALSESAATGWAENNVTEWSEDPAESVTATLVSSASAVPEEVLESLPWSADGLDNDECDLTVAEWIERGAKSPVEK